VEVLFSDVHVELYTAMLVGGLQLGSPLFQDLPIRGFFLYEFIQRGYEA